MTTLGRRCLNQRVDQLQRVFFIPQVLGNAEYLKGRYFAAFAAFEGFTGHDAVDVQLIRAVGRLHPVFGGVMVAVLLGRKSAGDQAEAQCQRQEHGQRTAGKRMILVQVHISSLDFLMGC